MKKIITIIVVVLALAGAAYFAYSAFNNESAPGQGSNKGPALTILPFGNTLDFKALSDFNKNNRIFPYPKVTPAEIGNSN